MTSNKDRIWSAAVLIGVLAVIGFNIAAGIGALNGVRTNEVSDRFATVLTPAGYTFTIWGLVYLGLLAFSIYQLLPSRSKRFSAVRPAIVASCIFNCLWLNAWHHYRVGICFLLIAGLFASLILIIAKFTPRAETATEAILTKGVFGIYGGWVTAASLINLLIWLKAENVDLGSTGWTVLGLAMIAVAIAAAVIVRLKFKNYLYALALAWAGGGIGIGQSGHTAIVVGAALLVIAGLVTALSFVLDPSLER